MSESEGKYIRVNSENLTSFSQDILTSVGLNKKQAAIVTESLIQANLRGIDTHGITRLPIYSKRLDEGIVNKDPDMTFEKKSDTTAVLDGNNGQGQVVGMKATQRAIKMATEKGVGFVAVKHSNHFGTASYFGMKIMQEDQIGLIMSNAPSTMVAYGSAQPFFGTNPIAITIPSGKELPIVIDMATSVVAQGKIILADKEGKDIPIGWAVDNKGRPTTDAEAALNGAVLPLGGHKGSALALMIDVFCGVLSGASWGKHLKSMWINFEEKQDIGHFIGAINIKGFMDLDLFKERVDQIIREIKNLPTAPSFKEVCLPGELEYQSEQKRLKEGIPLGDGVKQELIKIGIKYQKDFISYLGCD